MDKAILPAFIGAASGIIIAATGWFVSHWLSYRREVAARQDNAAREFLERQIQELYGPLLGLLQQSRTVFEVASRKLPTDENGQIDFSRFSKKDGEIWDYFVEEYFLPVNAVIRDLIRGRMHLLDAGILPGTFEHFFSHAAQFEAFHRLWKAEGVDSSEIPGVGWPPHFETEVEQQLNHLRERHQAFLRQLGVSSGNVGDGS